MWKAWGALQGDRLCYTLIVAGYATHLPYLCLSFPIWSYSTLTNFVVSIEMTQAHLKHPQSG